VIFVSYSSRDRGYVDQLVAHLKKHGVPVWYDPNIRPGDRYVQAIEQAIDGCTGILVVMSGASKASKWVESECEAAAHRHKRIVPFLLEGTPFLQYASTQYVDVRGGRLPDSQVIDDLKQIAAGLQPTPRAVLPVARAPSPPSASPSRPGEATGRPGFALFVFLVVAALLGGAVWGGLQLAQFAKGELDTNSPFRTSSASALPLVERLVAPVSVTSEGTTFSVTGVRASAARVELTLSAENMTAAGLEIWMCCQLVEQPSGRQQGRSHLDGGDFGGNVPAGVTITGSAIYDGGLMPETTSLVLVLEIRMGPQVQMTVPVHAVT
jgi:TIR domain